MKYFVLLLSTVVAFFLYIAFKSDDSGSTSGYDVYQYVQDCKRELGIEVKLPRISCLDGKQVPIYVNQEEIRQDNWPQLVTDKKCDNPHWLGGDMGCWTYSHLQVLQLDDDNVMVVNCRQKGGQRDKKWYRDSSTNLGMDQRQRKAQYEKAYGSKKVELYYMYNTFNDLGVILRNTRTGKACYLTQYGETISGFLPPLDEPLPAKSDFLKDFNPDQARPPWRFPEDLWYRDANKAFKSPSVTAAGCINCHNAHGFKYSPYINSRHGLPDIYSQAPLPMLLVGQPYIDHFRKSKILQLNTVPIDGEDQVCTRCHKMTTTGTCGYLFDFVQGRPDMTLHHWLTKGPKNNWMPPVDMGVKSLKKHVAAMECCCKNPGAKGCLTRKLGPTEADLPKGFKEGKGWLESRGPRECVATAN